MTDVKETKEMKENKDSKDSKEAKDIETSLNQTENDIDEGPNVKTCRYYENKFPEVDECVVVEVKSIEQMGAYVALKEYNNIEGMILLSELSRRRIRSINKIIRVGKLEVVVVLRVDKEKGYIDLSKRRVTEEDVMKCEQRYNKAKAVHSIMRHISDTTHQELENLYTKIVWPLDKKFGTAYDAMKISLGNPKILEDLNLEPAVYECLTKNIKRKLTPQPVKIRADIEVTCYHYEGIDAIKDSLRAGAKVDEKIKIKLVAPPLYVVITTSMNKDEGINLIENSIQAIKEQLKKYRGELVVRVPARLVHERDDRELQSLMDKSAKENEEVPADDDTSEPEGAEREEEEEEEKE